MILNVPISENIQLRDLEVSDATELSKFIVKNEKHFARFLPQTSAQNMSEALSTIYILKKAGEHLEKSQFTFAIVSAEISKILGLVILKNIDYNKKQGEIAYGLDEDQQGKGLTSASVRAMIDFAFEDLQLKTLEIITHKTNKGSVGVALNNDFEWTKTLFKEFTPQGETPLNMELYILKNE